MWLRQLENEPDTVLSLHAHVGRPPMALLQSQTGVGTDCGENANVRAFNILSSIAAAVTYADAVILLMPRLIFYFGFAKNECSVINRREDAKKSAL